MAESGKFATGHRNAPDSVLKEHLPEYSQGPAYYITSTYSLHPDSFSLPEPTSGLEGPFLGSPDTKKKGEAIVPAHPAQPAGGGSYRNLAQSIGITRNPVHNTRSQVKIEPQNRMSNPGSPSPFTEAPLPAIHAAGGLHDSVIQGSRKRMDLPRGRFRALKKNTCLLILLPELHVTAFTGYSRINLGSNATLLVFDQGRIVLAEYDGLAGDVALDRIFSHIYNQVDVLLNDLDDSQIRLALEFNPSWKVSIEQGLPCFSCHEGHPLAGAESVASTVNRTTDMPALKTEMGEKPELSVSVKQVQETDKVVPVITAESHHIPESLDEPDWKQAIGMPIEAAAGTAVPEKIIEERPEPESPDEFSWKNALQVPVEPAITVPEESLSDERKASAIVGLPARSQSREQGRNFDLLSADSGLLEDKPVKRKFLRVKYPEPAEHWKSMNVNRGQNTSV